MTQIKQATGPILTWTEERDHLAPNNKRFVLRSPSYAKHHFSPLCGDDRLAACGWRGSRTWRAEFYLGYNSIWAEGATAASAIKRLEAELDKRSIGIFGADAVTFNSSVMQKSA